MSKVDSVIINFDVLKSNNLSINEYLTLYDLVCPDCITDHYRTSSIDVINLEKKGLIKLTEAGTVIREKARKMFRLDEDYFLKWLTAYPVRVVKSTGGSRVLSPAKADTIEGRKLRKKWQALFVGNPEAEEKAIKVLELEVAMRIKSKDLEYMVEATRWLNGGYHEKMEYLLEEKTDVTGGIVDNYEEDWN
tara:strand:- start:647 stop:1219 length:573 start_codon:yes stop_codon:yes gene_type:complete